MNPWQHYVRPESLAGALEALGSAPRPIATIAGGTDLLLDLEQGRRSAVNTLVDITQVAELCALEIRDDRLFVGAAVPLSHVVRNALVTEHALALKEACQLIGGPQVRNVATLGGNVAHALPAADGTIALLALDAEVEVAAASGTRIVPLSQLFGGPGKSTLRPGEELLVGFHLSLKRQGQAGAFKRMMRPQGVALPILNVAVWLWRAAGLVEDVRIAVGPGSATPWRARSAEQELIGKPMNQEQLKTALAALLSSVSFRSSARRASAEYRKHLVATLLEQTVTCAWGRAA